MFINRPSLGIPGNIHYALSIIVVSTEMPMGTDDVIDNAQYFFHFGRNQDCHGNLTSLPTS